MTRKVSKNKLVCGWGINDVDYNVYKYQRADGKRKCTWICPYYQKWKNILIRCFDHKLQEKRPTYKGCTIVEDWKCLSNFIKWVDSQPNRDWQNCEPDKDFLSVTNKHYSPETVVFVSSEVNKFINARGNSRGDLMLGVIYCRDSSKNPYRALCRNPLTYKNTHVGLFPTEIEAHKAWQAKKHEIACILADMQEDERVAKALRERYALDKDWTNK